MQPMVAPLSPPPTGLAIATQSSQWRTIWKMLGIVFLLYIIAQIIVTALYGIVVDDAYTTLFSLICLVPFAGLFFFVRRPKLTHVILATPDQDGSQLHHLPNSRVLKTPVTTRFSHHLIIDSPPLEMPPSSSIWFIFITTIIVAFCGLLPMMLFEDEMWILLAVCVGIPAWLLGFSLPVHAWWSFSNRHFQLITKKRDGESMLVAGMLSTIPAIVINSLLFPLMAIYFGVKSFDPGTFGEFLLLAVSAPVGEELCKAAFVLSLYKIIDSPKRGFQIGFSVGLGFALLENLQYIMMSFGALEYSAISFSFTAIIRGIGSIPGHAFWTGLSGASIGWYLCTKRGTELGVSTNEASNWMVYDPATRRVIQHEKPTTFVGEAVKKWLDKPVESTIQLPRNPLVGISLAIAGHSIWNGSSWLISYIFRNVSDGLFVIVNLGWIVVLIAGLWFIGREILASVKHLPS
ncbi:MAG: hypothetical protein CMB20_005125 [Methanobacteriota archaeon]|nr:MAG: hypothetical protein CMB20_005125 [Euryarchaeota archaeon]